jgi:hypothetical protein
MASVRWRRAALVLATLAAAIVLSGPAPGAGRSAGDEPPEATALPPDLQRVPPDALGFVSLRLADMWGWDAAKGLRARLPRELPAAPEDWLQGMGVPWADIERWTAVLLSPERPEDVALFFVATARPYDRARVLANIAPDGKEEKKAGHVFHVNDKGYAVTFLSDRAFVTGSAKAVGAWLERPDPPAEGRLTAALRLAAGRHAVVAGVNPGPIIYVAGSRLPREVEPFKPLLKAKLATLTVDPDEGLRGVLRLRFAEEKDAREAEPVAKAGLRLAGAALGQAVKQLQDVPDAARTVALLKQAGAAQEAAEVRQQGAQVEVSVHLKAGPRDAAVIEEEFLPRIRDAHDRMLSTNNLSRLTLATINYADSRRGRLPTQAVYGADGKPLLSWRVLILPYLEQDDLYRQFHLDEPWDGPHNKKLLARMPRVFALPGSPAGTSETHYLAFVGKSAFFEGKEGLQYPVSFPDGTGNTIMYVEASKGVPWTKPEDLPFDPAKPLLPLLGGHFRGGFNVSMGNGAVRFVSKEISEKTLRAVITRDAADLIGDDW